MPKAKPPREFKFVGAYSRKRRRQNGSVPNGSTAPGSLIEAEPTSRSAAKPTATTSSPRTVDDNHKNKDKPVEGPDPGVGLPFDEMPAALAATPLTSEEVNHQIESEMLLDSSNGEMNQGNDLDWSYSSLMNPFLDPGPPFLAPFDQFNGPNQLPIYFGPHVPLLQLEEGSSTDNSPQDDLAGLNRSNCGDGATIDPSTIEEIVLQSLGSQEATSNLSLTISQLLTRYDQEFCVIPVTHDFEANPFRFDAENGRDSQLLLHCILALSYKHINRDTGSYASEAKTHKKKALQMLRDMEGSPQASTLEATLLDAVLILMTLDCATSAHGPWTWYLKRAHKMIEATKSLNIKQTPKMQARIEMLVWWDVTLALTSRQGCVLSETTIISLFNRDKTGDKTFYSVSGCPETLFRHMIRLGSYAREFEIVANMTCVKFDVGPVLEVEKQISEWTDPEYGDLSDPYVSEPPPPPGCDVGELAHYKEDLHHCAEAWRYCLLIYIGRVFKWQRDQPAPPFLGFLARKTLNHVTSCRYTSMLQKQLLLPVFLAGCETTDDHLRQAARTYCNWWNERTRYDMFLTANTLLEEVWSDNGPSSWWGSVIDQKSRSNVGAGDARQYLFG